MCFTFSILLGTGSSLVYTPSVVILGHYFSKYLGIVNGFVTTGSSLFAVALPHTFKFLFKEIGVSDDKKIFFGATFYLIWMLGISNQCSNHLYRFLIPYASHPDSYQY